jgi:hypothetical protein
MTPKYPHVRVQLIGRDRDAFAVLGRVCVALRRAKVPNDQIRAFMTDAMSSDYDHLMRTCSRWVDCDGKSAPPRSGIASAFLETH